MRLKVETYIAGNSAIHACDTRVKIVLLAAYSITLFLVDTWVGLGLCALAFAVVLAASGIAPSRVFGLVVPVYVLVAFMVVASAFSFDAAGAADAARAGGFGGAAPGVFAEMPGVCLVGSFGFVPAGFARGCFFAVRVLLLVFASLVVSFTSTSTDLTSALNGFLSPLRRLGVPTDDVAMVFSLALRFIPVTAEEFGRVYDAQWSRGASFGEGSLWQRLRAWRTVLVPLFVGLFRRADVLAQAMDARCYGAPDVNRTSLTCHRFSSRAALTLVAGLALCVALAVWL